MYRHFLPALVDSQFRLSFAQITEVKTFNFDSSNKRDTMIDFPDIEAEKIIMQYTMRCRDGLVSTGTDRNKGCGEWDYSCNTFVTDSSRIDSSLATAPSHIISNFSGNLYNFVFNPTHTYIQRILKPVKLIAVSGESKKTVGTGSLSIGLADQNAGSKRHLYLFTKEELGAFAGKIQAMEWEVLQGGATLKYLRIKMGETDADNLTAFYTPSTQLVEVKYENVVVPASGILSLPFYNGFTWSGNKNLVVELNYEAGNQTIQLAGHQIQMERTAVSTKGDRYWKAEGSSFLNIPADEATSIDNEITVAFWSFGNPDILPANTAALEAVDDKGNRQIMIHLPWSNGNVYWDCGNDGSGYNRINKAANVSDYEGKWHFWAFTKNVTTGSMKIYLDGVLFHSGTGQTKKIDIRRMTFGGSIDQSLNYPGYLDDLTIWNKELDLNNIKGLMQNEINGSNTLYNNLVYQYQFNESSGLDMIDVSAQGTTASFNKTPSLASFLPGALFKNFRSTAFRPNTTFVKGNFQVQQEEEIVLDSIANAGNTVRSFYVENNNLKEATPTQYWQSGEQNVLDEEGKVIDVVVIDPDSTLFIEDLTYFQKRPMKFELMSFVTPYGIGLDFGMGGKTWNFDVSDFAPVLKGRKRLTMEFGGQNQEEMDIRFLYYPGTAPRKVLDIAQIWPVNAVGFNSIISNNSYEKRNIEFHADTKSAKIRSAITGHGQEGEFIPQTHSININGGPAEWSWQVWKECADNPVYPQGGTWIYDRAGWCPGAPTDLKEYDVTPYVANQSMEVDYGINTAQGDSRYIVNHQLVQYGPASFANDAAVVKILRPNTEVEFGRFNPMCIQPQVEIRNTGSENLTSLQINYGTDGNLNGQFNWSGNLSFMQSAKVDLPLLQPTTWQEGGVFTVSVSLPNGKTDAYSGNNQLSTTFAAVPKHTSTIIIDMRTNGASNETSWVLTDVEGNILKQRKGGLSPNKDYTDTIKNLNGCYLLKISDTGDDGISFWANSDGSGYLGIRSLGQPVKQFNGDFGKEINYQFVASTEVATDEPVEVSAEINVYPNPTAGQLNIECSGIEEDGQFIITDVMGRNWARIEHRGGLFKLHLLETTHMPAGLYFVTWNGNHSKGVKTFIKM
ncbi:MAG: hypothetical protein IPH94_09470 [Saprospiraceae bacterium]|nr:hypothetical protein [Saprospiraceae bacterium]